MIRLVQARLSKKIWKKPRNIWKCGRLWVRWLGGRKSDGPEFRGYASCTRPGFRPAGNFRFSPGKVVKHTYFSSPPVLRPLLCPSHSGACAAYKHVTHSGFQSVTSERSVTFHCSFSRVLNSRVILKFVVSCEEEWFWVGHRIINFCDGSQAYVVGQNGRYF